MKVRFFLMLMVGWGLSVGALAAPDADHAELVRRLTSGQSQAYRTVLRAGLLKPIALGRADATFKAKVPRLVQDEAYALALARYAFLSECDTEALDAFCRAPAHHGLIAGLLADRVWLEELLCSGGMNGAGHRVLAVLGELWEAEPDAFRHPHYRKLATAIALGFGASQRCDALRGERGATPVGRLRYFMQAHRAGRLHRMFDTFEVWDMYYLAVVPTDDASLPWLLENVNVPLERYMDACWMCEYRAGTVFGGWIHAAGFYAPWESTMSKAENTYLHGGVCGSLSYYGSMAAVAHGIPAFPMGQPGHCAYGVRVARKDWRGGFGGPYGGAHVSPFDALGDHTDFVFLAESIFSDWSRNVLSRRMAWLGTLLADAGSRDQAMAAYQFAIKAQPENVATWADALAFVAANPVPDAKECEMMATTLGRTLGPQHPYVAIALVRSLEEVYVQSIKGADADRLTLWTPIYEAAAGSGWYGWQNIHAWSDCLGRLGKEPAARIQFLELLVHSSRESASTLATVLGWSQEKMKAPDEQAALIAAVGRSMGSSRQGDEDPKAQRDFYNKLVLMTESAQALESFQSVSRKGEALWDEEDRNRSDKGAPAGMPQPAGKLLSAGGLLHISSTSGWDRPLLHARVLTEGLGFFHTAGEVNPWVQVTLPKLGEPSGMIIVPEGSAPGRLLPLQVLVSEDGNQWTKIWETDSMAPYWVVPVEQRLRVRHVKVERGGSGGDVFHLRGVLVYGRDLQ